MCSTLRRLHDRAVRRGLPLVLAAALLAIGPAMGVAAEQATEGAQALRERAQAAMAALDWPAAVSAFEALVAVAPEDGQAWLNLGRSRQGAEDWAGAITAYEKTVEVGGQGGIALYQGARCWLQLGNKDKAIEWLGRLADGGSGGYQAVIGTPAFEVLKEDPRFVAVVERMRPCSIPEHRQFDFWLGEWNVTGTSGQPAGTNRITSIHEGCGLKEQWRSATGSEGTSLNFYDAAKGVWHQTWIDDSGTALYLDGGLKDGAMVLESDPSQSPWHRVSWTPLPEGKVRQLWQSSTDSGESWGVVFDGLYAPAGAAAEKADG